MLLPDEAFCQADTITTFYDGDWNKLSDSARSEYSRVAYLDKIGHWQVADYYKSGQLQMTGAFTDREMKKQQGLFEWFYPSGKLKTRTIYSEGMPMGESFEYYENGQVDVYTKYDDSGKIEEMNSYKEDGTDSVIEQPKFPGGISAMYRYLGRRTKYPKSLKKRGISGKVYITFVVHTDGSLQEVRIIDSPHTALSEEAVKVVSAMPRWKPGSRDGKSVRVKYNLPISFSLN